MLYIKISDDWHFQTENHCDLLINKVDSRRIWISGLCGFVPSYLANDQNFEPPLPISSKLPPQTNEIFLEYLPNKNGLLPSLWVERVSGIKKHERDTCSYACGARFFQSFPEGPRREALQEWSDVQRENRRHSGDSPEPT